MAHIELAAETDWKAAAWLLERQYPERWSRGLPTVQEGRSRDGVDELAGRRAIRRERFG